MEAAQVLDPVDGIGHRLAQHPAIARRRNKHMRENPPAPVRPGAHCGAFTGMDRTDLKTAAKQGRGDQSAHGKQKMAMAALFRRCHGAGERGRHEDRRAAVPDPEKDRHLPI